MKTDWKGYMTAQTAKKYQVPEGWETRDAIAKELECLPERVRIVLAPGIASGEVQTKAAWVFDPKLKVVRRVQLYRMAPKGKPPVPKKKTKKR